MYILKLLALNDEGFAKILVDTQQQLQDIIKNLDNNYKIEEVKELFYSQTGKEFLKELKENNKPKGLEFGTDKNDIKKEEK